MGSSAQAPQTLFSVIPTGVADFLFRAAVWRVGPRSALFASRVLHRDGRTAPQLTGEYRFRIEAIDVELDLMHLRYA
jgi:hypothetical protein